MSLQSVDDLPVHNPVVMQEANAPEELLEQAFDLYLCKRRPHVVKKRTQVMFAVLQDKVGAGS